MLRALASLFFYARFFSRFSRMGLRQRQRDWKPYPESLHGQTWLVTGASGGIGAAITRQASERGRACWPRLAASRSSTRWRSQLAIVSG